MRCEYARSLACLAVYGHFSFPLPREKVVFRVHKTFILNLKMVHHFGLRPVKIEIVRIPEQSIKTPPLFPLFSNTQNHCTPAGWQTPLCGGQTKNSRAPVPERVFIAFHGMNFRTPVHTIGEVISMSYVNPAPGAHFADGCQAGDHVGSDGLPGAHCCRGRALHLTRSSPGRRKFLEKFLFSSCILFQPVLI